MSREQLVVMAKRNLAHARNNTVDLFDGVYRVPASNYFDEARWRLEMGRVFKRVPLTLGFSAELPSPGDYKAMEVAGVPVLLSRGTDGAVRSFVNSCTLPDKRSKLVSPSVLRP